VVVAFLFAPHPSESSLCLACHVQTKVAAAQAREAEASERSVAVQGVASQLEARLEVGTLRGIAAHECLYIHLVA
jgi:hypothetical protein